VKKPAVQSKNGWCLKIVAANFKMRKTEVNSSIKKLG
jgi:hypothetical protein